MNLSNREDQEKFVQKYPNIAMLVSGNVRAIEALRDSAQIRESLIEELLQFDEEIRGHSTEQDDNNPFAPEFTATEDGVKKAWDIINKSKGSLNLQNRAAEFLLWGREKGLRIEY